MFEGSYVALVTPMLATGDIDYDALVALVKWHLKQGTEGFVILGTTGEAAMITPAERTRIVTEVVVCVAKKVPVIVGTGAQSTPATIALTRQAIDLGADGVLLVTPYYVKPTQQGLYEHFQAISQQCAIPQVLYNVPARTGCDLLPETVARLSHESNIVALKDATGDLTRLQQLIDLQCGLIYLSGDDATAMDFLLAGGKGVISVMANVMPRQTQLLCAAAIAGERDQASLHNEQLMRLCKVLSVESNPIPVKWALQQMGSIAEGVRLPLTRLDQRFHKDLLRAMQQVGVL